MQCRKMSLAEKLIPPILKNLYVMWFLPLYWQTNGHVLGKGGYCGINLSIYFINLNNLTHNVTHTFRQTIWQWGKTNVIYWLVKQKWLVTFFSNIDNNFWCNVNKDLSTANRITDSWWFLKCLYWSVLGDVINKTETGDT